MQQPTKLLLSITLAILLSFTSTYGRENTPHQLKGLFQLTSKNVNTENNFEYIFFNDGLTVYFTQNRVSYVIKSSVNDTTIEGQRIDFTHENSSTKKITSELSVIPQAKINISINETLYSLSRVDTITFQDLYEHIDLKYFLSNKGELTYHYYLDEGAEVNDISVRYNGADRISISPQGELLLENSIGELKASAPKTFKNQTKEVKSNYTLLKNNILSYSIQNFSPKRKYIIDPIISYSTYIGDTGSDIFEDISIDDSSNIYVVGTSLSNNFPTTAGAFDRMRGGDEDLVIFKMDSLGQLKWSTYYGGKLQDEGKGIAVSDSGTIFVTGFSRSFNLPNSDNIQPGNESAFLLIFENDGSLRKARFLGGNSRDEGVALTTLDENVYITGFTSSINFPLAGIGLATINNGGDDVFVTALNDTAGIIWSRYYGGSTGDRGRAITIDNQNNILIGGETESTDLPLLLANQNIKGASDDGFIARFNLLGVRTYSSYFGGDGRDIISNIKVDDSNNFYIYGDTRSTDLNFPITGITFQNTLSGSADLFLTKFNTLGLPQWGTYYGDTSLERGLGLDVSSNGYVIVTGQTESVNFPIDATNAIQPIKSTEFDAFILQFDSLGNRLYASFLGGNGNDDGKAVTFDPNQSSYIITGNTRSTDFPVAPMPFQSNNAGGNDLFIYTTCSLIPNNNITAAGVDTLPLCSNETPSTIDGTTPIGGSGSYTFEYQLASGNSSFTTVQNSNVEDLLIDTADLDFGFNTYRRIVTDGFCVDTSNIIVVLFLEAPETNFSFDTLCVGDVIQFTDETSLSNTTDSLISWTWNFDNGSFSTEQNPTTTYAASGTYTIQLKVEASNTCTDSTNKNLTINTPPMADFNFTTECENDTVRFMNTSTNVSIQEYLWNFGDGNTSNLENPFNVYDNSNSYDVTLIVGNAKGCSDTVAKTITIDSSIVADFTFTNNRCEDSTITFTDQSQVLSGIVGWNWNFGNGSTSTLKNPTTVYSTEGNYTVKLIVTSGSGCIDSVAKVITIGTPPVADFSFEANCINQPTKYTDASTSSSQITQWFYDFGDGNSSTLQNPENTYIAVGVYNVSLTVVNEEGCTDTETKSVSLNNRPTVEAGNDVTIIEGQEVQLNATSNSPNITAYNWTPTVRINPTDVSNPTASPTDTIQYIVTVTNNIGCLGVDSVTVNVNPKFFIPSAFTPNGDGENDDFVIEGINRFPNHTIDIFNRWGLSIYSSNGDYSENPWNGEYDGEQMPLGTYYYVLNLGDNSKLLKGTITILR